MDEREAHDLGELTRQLAATIESLLTEIESLRRELEEARLVRQRAGPSTGAWTERRFGITDIMMLVAAIAVGLTATQMVVPGLTPRAMWDAFAALRRQNMTIKDGIGTAVEIGAVLVLPSFAACTLCSLLVRLRRPRPTRHRFVRQPGAMACMVAALCMVVVGAIGSAIWVMAPDDSRAAVAPYTVLFGTVVLGLAVLHCWVVMALAGRWCPERTWIDRMGRFIGLGWIMTALVFAGALIVFWPF